MDYMTEFSPDNNTHVYQVKDKEAAPIDLLKDTVGWVGKNEFFGFSGANKDNINITKTSNGYRIQYASSSTYANAYSDYSSLSKNTTYRISTHANITSGKIAIVVYGSNDASTFSTVLASSADYTSSSDIAVTFNVGDYNYVRVRLFVTRDTASSADVTFENLMLYDSTITDSTYEPYHESVEQTLRDAEVIEGKNLFRLPYYGGVSQSGGGITFTVDEDGIIDINGTATEAVSFCLLRYDRDRDYLSNFAGQTLIASGTISEARIVSWDGTTERADSGNGLEVNVNTLNPTNWNIAVAVSSGVTCNHVKVKPLLCTQNEWDKSRDFEPYYIPLKDSKVPFSVQNVMGAKNFRGDYSDLIYSSADVAVAPTSTGYRVSTVTNGTYRLAKFFYNNLPKNTDLKFHTNLAYTSGKVNIGIYGASNTSEEGTKLAGTSVNSLITTSGVQELTFNTGNYAYICVQFTITWDVSEAGDVSFNDFMFTLPEYTDDTYVPYAMTNRELTEMMTPVEGTITTEGTLDTTVSSLVKIGKTVFFKMKATGVTKDAWASFASVPSEYKPKQTVYVPCMVSGVSGLNYCQISTNGYISCSVALSNTTVTIVNTSWITS